MSSSKPLSVQGQPRAEEICRNWGWFSGKKRLARSMELSPGIGRAMLGRGMDTVWEDKTQNKGGRHYRRRFGAK